MAILWEQAVQALNEEDQRVFKVNEPSPKLFQDILASIEQQRDFCLASQIKFRGSRGREIKIRDLCNRTIAWVTKFVEIGDVVAQFSPSYASLPWAGFRLLIQLGINNVETFKAMLEGLEKVSSLISRATIVEALYLPGTSDAHTQLEKSLLRLYTTVLEYLCKARDYYGKSSKKRMFSSILRPSEVDGNIQAMAREDSNVRRVLSLLDYQGQKTLASSIDILDGNVSSLHMKIENLQISQDDVRNTLISRDGVTSGQLGALHSHLEDDQRRELLLWMSNVPYDKHHADLKRGLLPESGKWLLQKSAYQNWKASSDSKLLSLHGPSGCGKTKLMAMVIEQLQAQIDTGKEEQTSKMAYFYCSRNPSEPQRADPCHILSALVKQLSFEHANGDLYECITETFKNRKKTASRYDLDPTALDAEDSTELLLQLLSNGKTIIVIDALDECDPVRRHILLTALETLVKGSTAVKLLISSRDETDITAWFQDPVCIRITEQDTREDIERFAQCRVDEAIQNRRILRGQVRPQLRQEIIETLRGRASGMFRWVDLQVEALRTMKSEPGIIDTLQHAPKSLMESYKALHAQMLEQDPESCAMAETVFKWLLCSMRTISVKETISILSEANAHNTLNSRVSQIFHILDCCYNFVVVDEQLQIIRFAHPSVREYLENEYSQSSTHLSVARRCMQVFTSPNDSTNEELVDYASLHWPFHYEKIESPRDRSDAQEPLWDLLFAKEYLEDWQDEMRARLQSSNRATDVVKKLTATISMPASPLFVITCFGLVEILQNPSASKLLNIDQINIHGASGLYLAARWGHRDVVKYCLDRDMDVNKTGGLFGSALQAASFSGHTNIVQLLLASGASALTGGEYPDAIQAALVNGNQEIAKLLLQAGYAEKGGVDHISLLTLARFGAYPKIAEMLQENYAHSDRSSTGKVPLQQALLDGKSRKAKELLSTYPDVDVEEGVFGTALQAAVFSGDLSLIKLLVDHGARIDQRGTFGFPLRVAVVTGHIEIVAWLLEAGANCNVEDDELGDCLQAAASKGHLEISSLLIDKRAEIDGRHGLFGTPLQAASFHGHKKVVKLLLDCGANISTPGRFRDSLHAAVYGNQGEISELLLSHGACMDPDLSDRGGQMPFAISRRRIPLPDCRKVLGEQLSINRLSPLELAASSGNTTMLQMLLEQGAKINGTNSQFNALQVAAFNARRPIVESLLGKKADVNVGGSCLGTALNAAVQASHWDIVKMLLSHGADINKHWTKLRSPSFLDDDLGSPLQVKCEQGDMNAVQALCDLGAEVNDSGGWNGTALQVASAEGHLEVTQFLIARGAKVNDPGRNLGTALQAAMLNDHSDIVDMLLAGNVDINVQGRAMGTALQAAAAEGLIPRVRELIRLGADIDAHQSHEQGNVTSVITNQARNLGTALYLASGRGHEEIVQILLENGANRHIKGSSPPGPTITYNDALNRYSRSKLSDALHQASCHGNAKIASLLIANDVEAYIQNGTLVEALNAAISNKHTDVVGILLQAGTEANLPKEDLSRLIFPVINCCNEDTLGFLIKNGADVNCSYELPEGTTKYRATILGNAKLIPGDTPLHTAAISGRISMAAVLISNGADVNALNIEAEAPLSRAIPGRHPQDPRSFDDSMGLIEEEPSMDRIDTIKLLIEAGANIKSLLARTSMRLFKLIALNGASKLLQLLYQLDPSSIPPTSSADFQRGLSLAVYHNQKSFLRSLGSLGLLPIDKGDAIYKTILSMAAVEGRSEIITDLIESGIPLGQFLQDEKDNPFVKACRWKRFPEVDVFLDQYPSIRSDILNLALDSTRDIPVSKRILQHVKRNPADQDYADIDQQRILDRNLRTAVWPVPDRTLAETLIDQGASVHNTNPHNERLLLLAAASNNAEMVETLIRHGANPDEQAGDTLTPLQVALTVYRAGHHRPCLHQVFPSTWLYKDHSAWIHDENVSRRPAPQNTNDDPILLESILVRDDPTQTGLSAGTKFWYQEAAEVPQLVAYFATALQVAVASNHLPTVKVLIECGANVNARGGTYGSALGVVRAKIKAFPEAKSEWRRFEGVLLGEGARE